MNVFLVNTSDNSETLSYDSYLSQQHPVLALPARNSLSFLKQAFACWDEGRVFAISRNIGAITEFGLQVEALSGTDSETTGWGRLAHQPRLSDAPAQITFSSGTEGQPKAIVISHRNLADVVTRLNQAMGVTDEIREYIGVPVTYSFGLGRARAVAAADGNFFLPERFDPVQIRDMLSAGEINAISAVPSLFRLLLANPNTIGPHGAKVRWIEIGSQYMSAADKLAMQQLFPQARIIQHYGLTEASRSTFLNVGTAPEDQLESVGQATGGVQVRVTAEGAIAIRGPHVALGVLVKDGKIRPLTDEQGWLVTRDRGEIRGGFLYYLGRLDDQINVAGVKLGAEGIEAEIRRLVPAAGEGFAIAPVADAIRGEAVLLAIEQGQGDHAALIEEAARLSLTRRGVQVGQGVGSVLKTLHLNQLPRTDTGKIQRRLLPDLWQQNQDAISPDLPASELVSELSSDERRVAEIWSQVVGTVRFTPESSFYDLGGDSLSSVQIGIVMEEARMPRQAVRATMEGRSLRVVASLLGAESLAAAVTPLPDAARRSWAITMMRAVMALSVLLSHWGPGFFERLNMGSQAETALSFLYRMGTPGFAAVFGIGIGYFMLPDFNAKRRSALRRLSTAFRLVLLGMVLLAGIRLINFVVNGQPIGGLQIAHAFYGVLAYYAVMLGTARWWLPPLARLTRPIPWLLAGLPVLWILWQIVPAILPSQQLQSLLEWPRLMLVAGYNVFKMSAVAAAGVAIGFWLVHQRDSAMAARHLLLGGALGMALTVLSLIEANGVHFINNPGSAAFTSLPGLLFYLSLSGFGIGLFLSLLLSWENLSAVLRLPLQILLIIGGLALPVYVFHQLVIPSRDLLVALGLTGGMALLVAVGLFLAIMAYSSNRLWRMYFGETAGPAPVPVTASTIS